MKKTSICITTILILNLQLGAHVLSAIQEGQERIKTCIDVIQNDRQPIEYRRNACCQLEKLGANARAAIPALMKAIRDEQLSYWAACALRDIGPEARQAVEQSAQQEKPNPRVELFFNIVNSQDPPFAALQGFLDSSEKQTRYWSIQTLSLLGQTYSVLAKDLPSRFEAISRSDPECIVRTAAAFAFIDLQPRGDQTVQVLTRVMIDKQAPGSARAKVAKLLGGFGAAARYAEGALVAALDEPDPVLQQNAATSLGQISQDEDVVCALKVASIRAAQMSYSDLYDSASQAEQAVLARIELAKRRMIQQKLNAERERMNREAQDRREKEIADLQDWMLKAKTRSDAQIYGPFGGWQGLLDEADYDLHEAHAYEQCADSPYLPGDARDQFRQASEEWRHEANSNKKRAADLRKRG